MNISKINRHPEVSSSLTYEGSHENSFSFTSFIIVRFFPRKACYTHPTAKVYQPLAGRTPKPEAYKSGRGEFIQNDGL